MMSNPLVKWAMQEAMQLRSGNTAAIAKALLKARALQASLDNQPIAAIQAGMAAEIIERSDFTAAAGAGK